MAKIKNKQTETDKYQVLLRKEQLELSCPASQSINCYKHFGNLFIKLFIKAEHRSYDPVI